MTTWREYYQKGKETLEIGVNQSMAYRRLAMDELLASKGFKRVMSKWFDVAHYECPIEYVFFNKEFTDYEVDELERMTFDDIMEKIVKKYLENCDNEEDIRHIFGDFRPVAKKYGLDIYLEKVN